MCEASIHVPHRRARAQEKLVVLALANMAGWAGLYPAFPTDPTARSIAQDCNKLVCTRGQTKAIIKLVRLQHGTAPNFSKAWASKKNIEVVLFRQYHHDMVKFPDGSVISLSALKPGTRIDIGIPVKRHKPGGMQMINKAIKEAMALPPDPKPGDEPQPNEPRNPEREPAEPSEPAPQREPERS
jgi:hypothetical protein